MSEPQRIAVIGGDLGGTKLAWAVYPAIGGRVSEEAVAFGNVPTQKGEEGLQRMMKAAYEAATSAAPEYNITAMGLCSPGRPLTSETAPKNGFMVAPRSAANLEATPGELDNRNLQEILQKGVPVPLSVSNDAVVQMQAMLVDRLRAPGRTGFLNKNVGYIGMGTGLGGGFANVDDKGNATTHTDGHIYDIRMYLPQYLTSNAADYFPKEMVHKDEFDLPYVRAEDVLSGTAFTRMTGLRGQDMKTDADVEPVRPVLELMGHALAELAEKIHSGDFRKLGEDANWPEGDLDRVKGTATFLMGGGLANQTALMDVIERVAMDELKQKGLEDIRFVAAEGKEPALAAANTVPQELLARGARVGV